MKVYLLKFKGTFRTPLAFKCSGHTVGGLFRMNYFGNPFAVIFWGSFTAISAEMLVSSKGEDFPFEFFYPILKKGHSSLFV
jgi:hypothetical protein